MPESNIRINNNPPDFAGVIEINQQADFDIDEPAIRKVVGQILADAGLHQSSISIAVIDDGTIHTLNKRYLEHDYPTDVLSFVLEQDRGRQWLEGEVIVSFDTAKRASATYGWSAFDELLLYIIHGTLHLTGRDDSTDELRVAMRQAETHYLNLLGRVRPAESDSTTDPLH